MLVSSGARKNASDWFRGKLKQFGYKRVSDIPKEIRYEFCLKSMIERVCHEKNYARS